MELKSTEDKVNLDRRFLDDFIKHGKGIARYADKFGLSSLFHFFQSWQSLVEDDVNIWSELTIVHLNDVDVIQAKKFQRLVNYQKRVLKYIKAI